MLKPEDLLPGDLIVSYKKPTKWQLIQKFFNWALKRYSYSIYGDDCLLPHMNHVRTVVGKIGDHIHCFDWSDPAASFSKVRDWMLDPEYSYVFRPRGVLVPTPEYMFNYFETFDGTLYDFLDPIGMWLRITRFFHGLSKKLFTCSTGSRKGQEEIIFHRSIDLDVSIAETPPCYPAQYSMLYEHISHAS